MGNFMHQMREEVSSSGRLFSQAEFTATGGPENFSITRTAEAVLPKPNDLVFVFTYGEGNSTPFKISLSRIEEGFGESRGKGDTRQYGLGGSFTVNYVPIVEITVTESGRTQHTTATHLTTQSFNWSDMKAYECNGLRREDVVGLASCHDAHYVTLAPVSVETAQHFLEKAVELNGSIAPDVLMQEICSQTSNK